MARVSLEDKFAGALIGGAIGDALGNPVEGWTRKEIEEEYGKIKGYHEYWEKEGTVTDDTILTLATLESLNRIGGFLAKDQVEVYIEALPKLNSFGAATQSSLVRYSQGSKIPSGSDSEGNGAAMRIAPIALLYSNPQDEKIMKRVVEESTKLTHNNPQAVAGAMAISNSLVYLINAQGKLDKYDFLYSVSKKTRKFSHSLSNTLDFLAKNLLKGPARMSKMLGTTGHVLDSVPFSLYCFLKSPDDFEKAVLNAVNAGGDTDTNASLAGQLSGAYLGIKKIPKKFIDGLSEKDVKEKIISGAKKLHDIYMEVFV